MALTTKQRLIEALTRLAEDADIPAKQRVDAARLAMVMRGDIEPVPESAPTAIDLLKE